MKLLVPLAFIIITIAWGYWLLGYHIVHAPTADQLYGCNIQNQDPATDECK